MRSRDYRKATSFIQISDGEKFRLTAEFKANLNLAIGRATEMLPTDTLLLPTVDGVTPMTLADMVQLRSAITVQEQMALKAEFTSSSQ